MNVKFGPVESLPGTRRNGWIPVTNLPDGTPISLPVIVVTGTQKGPVLAVDACFHAEEVEGCVAAIRLSELADPAELRGTLVLVPVLNVPAFNIRLRHYPYQWPPMQDFSLTFPGRPRGSITQMLANAYYAEVVKKADHLVSIHTGGGGDGNFNVERAMFQKLPESLEMAKALGGEWEILQEESLIYGVVRGGLLVVCEDEGRPAILLEVGGTSGRLGELLERTVGSIVSGVTNVMRHLGMLSGPPERPRRRWMVVSGKERELLATRSGILREEYTLKQQVAKGSVLARIEDLFGEEVEVVRAHKDGVILSTHPNPVVIAGDSITQIGEVVKIIEE